MNNIKKTDIDTIFRSEKQIGDRKFIVDIAETPEQLDAVYRLRYRIFNEELHEGLASSTATGRDEDQYDNFCDQLIIVEAESERIVGTYRLHRYDRAENGLGYYSSNEFDLTHLLKNKFRLLEIGRACIDPEFRDGSVMNLLWYGLARYMQLYNLQYLCGCVSLEKNASAEQASVVYAYAKAAGKLADDRFTIEPLAKNKVPGFNKNLVVENVISLKRTLPPLLRGYFTINCKIAGEPAYDPEFEVIDFFIIFDFSETSTGPTRRFLSI